MLFGVVGYIEFSVKCRCDNLLLDSIKHEFYTTSLPNSDEKKKVSLFYTPSLPNSDKNKKVVLFSIPTSKYL